MKITTFTASIVILIATALNTMPRIIQFAPPPKYFYDSETRKGVYNAEFPTGPPNSGLKEKASLCKYGGALIDLTSFLYTVQEIMTKCGGHGWDAQYFLPYVAGIMTSQSTAGATWTAVVDVITANLPGGLANMTRNDFITLIRQYTSEITELVNVGDQALDSLRDVQCANIKSRQFVDQQMEPKALFEELRKFLNILELVDTSNGVPAINSHQVKVIYCEMWSRHAQN